MSQESNTGTVILVQYGYIGFHVRIEKMPGTIVEDFKTKMSAHLSLETYFSRIKSFSL